MSDRFIKFIPSEEALFLLYQKPHAFRLLTIIAERARRYNGNPDGLKINEAFIGDWKDTKFTEQEYRTAKDVLISRKHIETVETNRTRGKSTTGVTTKGTKVKIISLSVYDINSEASNDRNNDRTTTEQRLNNDEQERKRKKEDISLKEKNKKEKILSIDDAESDEPSGELTIAQQEATGTNGSSPSQGTSDNIYSVCPSTHTPQAKKQKIIPHEDPKIKRRDYVHTSEKEHLDLIKFIEDEKEYAEKGGGEAFLELCYEKFNNWKSADLAARKNKCPVDGIKKWVAQTVKETQLKDAEIKIKHAEIKVRERRVNNYNVLQNASEQKSAQPEENEKYAKKIHEKFNGKIKNFSVILGSNYIEFSPLGGNSQAIHIKFSENGFKDQVNNFLRKCGFTI